MSRYSSTFINTNGCQQQREDSSHLYGNSHGQLYPVTQNLINQPGYTHYQKKVAKRQIFEQQFRNQQVRPVFTNHQQPSTLSNGSQPFFIEQTNNIENYRNQYPYQPVQSYTCETNTFLSTDISEGFPIKNPEFNLETVLTLATSSELRTTMQSDDGQPQQQQTENVTHESPRSERSQSRDDEEAQPAGPSSTPRTLSKGKGLLIKDTQSRNESSDDDGDDDEGSDLSDLEMTESIDINELLADRTTIKQEDLKSQINRITIETDGERDLYAVTRDRVSLLVNIGKYIDKKSKTVILHKGTQRLFAKGSTDVKEKWNEITDSGISLDGIPAQIRWIVVYLCIAYVAYAADNVVVRSVVIAMLIALVDYLKNEEFSVRKLISILNLTHKKIGTKLADREKSSQPSAVARTRGDIIDEPSSSFKETATAIASRREDEAAILSSDPVFKTPTPKKKRRQSQKYTPLENELSSADESDTGSCVSSASRASVSSTNRKRRYNMEKIAKQFPVPLQPQQERRVSFSKSTDDLAAHAVEDGSVLVENVTEETYTTVWPTSTAKRIAQIRITNNIYRDCLKYKQTPVGTLLPNVYLTEALRKTIIGVIDSRKDNVTFVDVLKQFVINITNDVIGQPSVDQIQILQFLSTCKDEKKRKAISECAGILHLLYLNDDSLVSVPWNVIKDWCVEFSVIINDRVLETIQEQDNELTTEKKFFRFQNKMEEHFTEKYACLLPIFNKLAIVSEICLYLFFGVNCTKSNDKCVLYTDFVVKNVFLIWRARKTFPLDMSEDNGKNVNAFWCFPIAYMLNFRKITKEEEDKTEKPCSFEEFMAAGLESYE